MRIQKRIIVTVIGALMLVGMNVSTSFAAVSCSDAEIVGVGNYPGQALGDKSGYRVRLTCHDTTPPWSGPKSFYLSNDQGKSGYATILTAFALSKRINVYLGGAAANSLIFNIYVNP